MHYQVEYGAHPDVANVHLALHTRLSRETLSFTLADIDQANGGYAVLIKNLLEVRGVTEIFVHGYYVTLHKDPAFAWDTVLWDALGVLNRIFNDGKPMQELANPTQQPQDPDCPTSPTPSTATRH